jgi:catechol 2,3-dioxygenase
VGAPFNILRTSHVEYRVTDLERARHFYCDLVGFVETARDADHLYLRGLEDRMHHSLVLTRADEPGAVHAAFRVAEEEDLDRAAAFFKQQGLWHRFVDEEERGVGRALRAMDPFGFPVEFVHRVDAVEWRLQAFDEYRGAAVMRLDHVNFVTPHIDRAAHWYMDRLGFWCSECTVSRDPASGAERMWGAWLRRKQTSHDLAISNGRGPRVHHAAFIAHSTETLLHVADVLASTGHFDNLERGPGRHGTTNAFFLYVRDPDGNRFELFTGDYLVADPDWPTVKWDLNDPRRATFWGAEAPARWFNEAMAALSWETGQPGQLEDPTLPDRPDARRK